MSRARAPACTHGHRAVRRWGHTANEDLLEALGRYYDLPSVSLRNVPANESVMKSIRESQANGSWKFGSARVAYDDRRDERGIPVPDAARGIHAKLAGVSNAKEPPGTPRSMPRGTPREVSRSGGTPRSGSVRV